MLKWMLLGGILCACAAAGRAASNIRRKRYDNLSEILAAMRVLRLRMLNSMEPVGILLRKSDSLLFRELATDCGKAAAWKTHGERCGKRAGQRHGSFPA